MQSEGDKSPQPVLILGGGRGGSALFELLSDESLFRVVGVADSNPAAPLIKLADDLGIRTFNDFDRALRSCRPCTVFNLTHDESLSFLAADIVGPSSVIGGLESNLIWETVTRLKKTTEERERSRTFSQLIISNATEGIILIDGSGIIKMFNPAAEIIFGYSEHEIVGKNINMLMPDPSHSGHDGFIKRYSKSREPHIIGINQEVTALRRNGQGFPLSLSVNEIILGSDQFFIGIVSDITDRKRSEEEIKQLAHFDPITGLPNRILLFDRINHEMAQAKRYKQKLALLFVDLDGFKKVNDEYGHQVGDKVLKVIAGMLAGSMREIDTVARFGGDEFVVVVNNIGNRENVAKIAGKLLQKFEAPVIVDDHQFDIGLSIGISLYPEHGKSADLHIRHADLAMYAVKFSGKNNFKFYSPSMESDA